MLNRPRCVGSRRSRSTLSSRSRHHVASKHSCGPRPLSCRSALPVAARRRRSKFGYVDFQRVLLEVDEGKAAKARLQKWLEAKQKEIDKEQEACARRRRRWTSRPAP